MPPYRSFHQAQGEAFPRKGQGTAEKKPLSASARSIKEIFSFFLQRENDQQFITKNQPL
jgi:hypothetical protein